MLPLGIARPSKGRTMRAVFVAIWLVILVGLVLYTVVGAGGL